MLLKLRYRGHHVCAMRLIIGVVLGFLFSGCTSSPMSAPGVPRIARETVAASLALGREVVALGCSKVTTPAPFDLSVEGAGSRFVGTLRDQTSLDELAAAKVHEVAVQVRHLSFKWRKAKPALERAMATTAKVELKALCAKVVPAKIC